MEGADALLGGLAGGDKAPGLDAPLPPTLAPLKREHDSTDDFEHLERGGQEAGEVVPAGARVATQSFLDMEREPPRTPSAADRLADQLADQLADKFTDSESDVDTAESPLHHAHPPPVQPAPPEPALLSFDPTPVLAPATPPPAPVPALAPAPREPSPQPLLKLSAEPEPKPKVQPPPPKPRDPSPPPKAKPEPKPVAHVIEAEVIFCQMGLGKSILIVARVTHSLLVPNSQLPSD